jgi:hypothetical protein
MEALKEALDDAETKMELRIKLLEQYESTLDEVRSITDDIQETTQDIADTRLDKIEARLDIVVTVKNMKDVVRDLTKEIAESFGDALTHGVEVAAISWEQAQADMGMLSEY